MFTKRNLSQVVVLAATLFLAATAFAQTASIAGTVTDAKDAVVQGASITVKNSATGATRAASTGSTGAYSLTNLTPGPYDVTVVTTGFRELQISNIILTVGQVATVNAKLEVGTTSERIEVRGDATPAIDLETSQISNVVDSRRIADLPLILRDPYSLVLLSPGTVQSNSGLGGFSSNGSSERDNNFLLDGVDNNDTSVPGIPGGIISANPDSTQEFRVITNSFLPEYGRNDGAIIDVVTKSGTNQFHGDAYEFGRYNGFGGARDYFNHNIDPNTGKIERIHPYVRNQFGFSFGGPIIKDKTFFFVNEEIDRFRTTQGATVTVPTAAFKSGKFTFTDMNGGTHLIDRTTPSSPNNVNGLSLDAATANILKLYPDPNGPLSPDGLTGLLLFPSKSAQNSSTLTTRIDHNFSEREVVSLRYDFGSFKDPDGFHDEFLPGLGATGFNGHGYLAGVTLTSSLRSTLVNEAKFGFNRNDAPFNCGSLSAINAVAGVDSFGRGRDFLAPVVTGFGCTPLGDSNGQGRRTGTWSVGDNLSWAKGRHSIKFGGEYRRVYENGANSFGSRDQVTFNTFSSSGHLIVDCNPPAMDSCGSSTLQDLSSFLFGAVDSENQSQYFDKAGTRTAQDFRKFRQAEYAFYGQDSWKVRPNLTLNYGLRYQLNGVPFETGSNLSTLFVDPSGTAPFTFQTVGPGTGRSLYKNDYKNIEPRFGFAWDPFSTGKTSIRGAYGIFHDRVFGNLFGNVRGNPPFTGTFGNFNLFPSTPETLPFPGDVPVSPVVQNGSITFSPVQPVLIDRNLRIPYTQGWNFGIQREVARDLTVDLSYVAKKGTHGLRDVDGNPPVPALVQQLIANGVDPASLIFSNLYFGAEFGNPNQTFDPENNNAFASASGAGGGAILIKSIGNSNYNSLQAKITKQFARGFQIQGAYTYAHAIADYGDSLSAAAGNRGLPRNSNAIANERGNSDFDIRQRFVVNYTWELPFGRGKAHLNSGIAGRALEGWQLSGITSWQTGHPYDIFYNKDVEHTGISGRGTIIGSPKIPAGSPATQTGPLRSAFCVDTCTPPLGVPGNTGRNHFLGPRLSRSDLVVSKNTSLSERFKLELRLEGYNIFNHTEFGQPDNLLQDNGTFGTSTATLLQSDGTTTARQLQVAIKLKF